MQNNNGGLSKGMFALFDDSERKHIFYKYILFMVVLELIILIFCWFYQLGSQEFDRFGPVDVPFPWRTYFLLAFIIPIAVTFILGVFIVGFNNYLYDSADSNMKTNIKTNIKTEPNSKTINSLETMINTLINIPFLLALLLLGIAAGIIYRIDDIMIFLGHVGVKSIQFILTVFIAILIGAVILGLGWLAFKYKLHKQSMAYQFKTDVMNRLGLVILDNNTIIDQKGTLIGKNDVLFLPFSETKKIDEQNLKNDKNDKDEKTRTNEHSS